MRQIEMTPIMVFGGDRGMVEMVRTDDDIYDIQKIHFRYKIHSILSHLYIHKDVKDKSNIHKCVMEDDYYLKNFNPNRFGEYDKDLINLQSKTDMKKFRDSYEDYMEDSRLYKVGESGYISPIMINWWFKHYRDEFKRLI